MRCNLVYHQNKYNMCTHVIYNNKFTIAKQNINSSTWYAEKMLGLDLNMFAGGDY